MLPRRAAGSLGDAGWIRHPARHREIVMDATGCIEIVRRYYDAINRRDTAAYDDLLDPDVELVAPGAEGDGYLRLSGIDAVRAFDGAFTTALPDMVIAPIATLADDDGTVISRNRVTGTHRATLHGPAGDLPPAGRRLDATYVGAFTVRGGRITYQQLYYDQVGLQVQLG